MYRLIGIDDDSKREKTAFAFCARGYGRQNNAAILRASEDAGTQWVVVEQDAHDENTAMEDSRLSIGYLRKIGL